MPEVEESNKTPRDRTERRGEIQERRTGGRGVGRTGGKSRAQAESPADQSRPAGGAAEKGPPRQGRAAGRG